MKSIRVTHLGADDVGLVASIDRSEHVEVEYCVADGALRERPVSIVDVPPWDATGDGEFSVAHQMEFVASALRDGATLIGAFTNDTLMGLAAVNPRFEPQLAWFAYLHVSRPFRRHGAATALWNETTRLARAADADAMYVSATPTGSAVGFYRSQGCQLADPPHPVLFANEPDDIHLVCPLR